jgi:hemoglobin
MGKDIENRKDIYKVVSEFYDKLFKDELMQPFFESFKEPKLLETHLQVLVDFWDGVLFDSGTYRKNAIQPHIEMNEKMSFTDLHFKQWIFLFSKSIDDSFKGEVCETAKSRAQSIAIVMQIKMIQLKK